MKILITGILGQDGANMAEYLLANTNYEIYGVMRRSANPNFVNCSNFITNPRFKLVYGDLGDSVSIDILLILALNLLLVAVGKYHCKLSTQMLLE